jgi:hypothetical protein
LIKEPNHALFAGGFGQVSLIVEDNRGQTSKAGGQSGSDLESIKEKREEKKKDGGVELFA